MVKTTLTQFVILSVKTNPRTTPPNVRFDSLFLPFLVLSILFTTCGIITFSPKQTILSNTRRFVHTLKHTLDFKIQNSNSLSHYSNNTSVRPLTTSTSNTSSISKFKFLPSCSHHVDYCYYSCLQEGDHDHAGACRAQEGAL